ncbi:MAG: hypothetical protein LBQ15_06135 [Clostridium sp.]|jgi:hypothetical protein|nr:hypothetical protein [Clostridium sp.]
MERRYEKTYAYCLRLLNRMEATPGYYPGIPIALNDYVDEDVYPMTDDYYEVVSQMIGVAHSRLIGSRERYRTFFLRYLHVRLNLVSREEASGIFGSDTYLGMGVFPAPDSMQVVDGVLYMKIGSTG